MTALDDLPASGAGRLSARATVRTTYPLARAASALAIFAAILASTTPSPLYPVYIAEWHLPQSAGTTIFSVYALGTLLALFLSSRIGRFSRDRRHVLLPGLVATAAGALIFAMADGVPMLLAGRFLSGVSTGFITAAGSAILYELSPPERRGRAAMVATVAFTGGAAAGPCLSSAALALDLAPLVSPFLCIAAIAALAFAGLATARWPAPAPVEEAPVAPADDRPLAQRFGSHMQARLFLLSALAVAVAWMLGSMIMALGVGFATTLFGLHVHAAAGLLPAAFQLFAGIGQVLSSRLRALTAILIGFAAIGLLQVLTAVGAIAVIPAVFIAMMPLGGLAYGAAFVGGATLVNETSTSATLTGRIARFYVVGYLANALPVFAMGFLVDAIGLRPSFLGFSAVIVVLGLGGALMALRARRDLNRLG